MVLKVQKHDPIGDFFGGVGGFFGDAVNNISHVVAPQTKPSTPHTYNKPVFGVQQNPTNPLDYLGNFGAGIGNTIASSVGLVPDLTNSAASVFQDQWHKDQAANQLAQDWNNSIPGGVVNNAVHTGGTLGNMGQDAFLGAIGDQRGAAEARARAKQEFDQTIIAAPFRLAVTGGATMAQNDLINKGYNPNDVLNAGNAITNNVGINSNDPHATQRLVEAGLQSALLPTSLYGGSAALGAIKGGVDAAKAIKSAKVALKEPEATVPTQIPVTKQGGGNVPIPVRVNTKIPVKVLPSAEESTKRFNGAMAQLQTDYGKESRVAELRARSTPLTGVDVEERVRQTQALVDEKYQAKFNALTEAEQARTLPKKIVVQDAPTGPKVTSKKPAQQLYDGPTMTKEQAAAEKQRQQIDDAIMGKNEIKPRSAPDMLTLNSKIKNVKDPVRRAELIAERDARLAKTAPETPPVAPQKGAGLISRLTQPTRDWIGKHGTGGKALANGIHGAREYSEVAQAAFYEKIPTVKKLSSSDMTKFVDTLDALSRGKKVSDLPKHIAKAVDEWTANIATIRQHALDAGLEVGDQGKYYFPREYKDLVNGRGYDRYIKQLTDQGMSMEEAAKAVQFMKHEYTRPYGHLESNRTADLPGYEKTHDAMTNYIARSYDRIGKAREFGGKNEKLNEMQAQMIREGYDPSPNSVFDKQLKIAMGDVDHTTTGHKVSSAVRQVNAATSLSAAGVSNAAQVPVNTATVAGIGRTVKGVYKYATDPAARKRARETGVGLDHMINDIGGGSLGVEGTTVASNLKDKLTKNVLSNLASPFFRTVEKFNRQATAIVGEDWGNSLAKKASNGDAGAEKTLRDKLGVTGEIGEKLTREQEIQASRKLVEIAQFKVDPQDLPGWVDSPMGKLAAQFRTFGYKQTGFVWTHVLKEAGKGNLLPLTRYVALATPVGMTTKAIKSTIKLTPEDQNQDQKKAWEDPLQGFLAAGGLGLVSSEPSNIANGIQYDNLPGAVAGTLGGPTASLIAETANNAQKAINGNARPLIKEGIRKIPAVGPTLSNVLVPSKQFTPGKTDPSTLSPDDLKKFEGASYDEFKKSLVKSDQDIFGLQQNKDAGTLALRNGKVNQNQLDDMQAKYNRYKQSVGLPIDYINSLTPEQFSKLDQPTQALVTEASLIGAKKFGDKTTVDPTAKAAIESAKQNAWPNTGDIQPTNKLALDYVNTLKKMQDVPDDQGQQYELYKSFWKGAVKAQYSDAATAGYGSSIADLRRLSGGVTLNGKTYSVKRSDLDSMVDLDNRLLVAGLIDSPKFSNKTRAEAGYPPAPASATDGVGYDGGSSGSGGGKNDPTANAYQYAISRTAGGAAPKVRVKAPSGGGSTKVALKKGSGKPKVSIKKSLV